MSGSASLRNTSQSHHLPTYLCMWHYCLAGCFWIHFLYCTQKACPGGTWEHWAFSQNNCKSSSQTHCMHWAGVNLLEPQISSWMCTSAALHWPWSDTSYKTKDVTHTIVLVNKVSKRNVGVPTGNCQQNKRWQQRPEKYKHSNSIQSNNIQKRKRKLCS